MNSGVVVGGRRRAWRGRRANIPRLSIPQLFPRGQRVLFPTKKRHSSRRATVPGWGYLREKVPEGGEAAQKRRACPQGCRRRSRSKRSSTVPRLRRTRFLLFSPDHLLCRTLFLPVPSIFLCKQSLDPLHTHRTPGFHLPPQSKRYFQTGKPLSGWYSYRTFPTQLCQVLCSRSGLRSSSFCIR